MKTSLPKEEKVQRSTKNNIETTIENAGCPVGLSCKPTYFMEGARPRLCRCRCLGRRMENTEKGKAPRTPTNDTAYNQSWWGVDDHVSAR
jgi:hypothetical protein